MSYQFSGEFTVATARDEVFATLGHIERFVPLLPTYISHVLQDDGSAVVKVNVGVGKVKGTGEVVLKPEETVEPVRAAYSGKGKVMGGAFNLKAGFELEDVGHGATKVKWQGEMAMFGKLVSLAGGLVKPIAERDINQMIQAVQVALGGAVTTPVTTAVSGDRPGIIARFVAWLMGLFNRKEAQPHDKPGSGNSGTPGQRG